MASNEEAAKLVIRGSNGREEKALSVNMPARELYRTMHILN